MKTTFVQQYFFGLFLLALCGGAAQAQTPVTRPNASTVTPPETRPDTTRFRLVAKAKYFGDSVVLRWSLSDAVLWQLANQAGYTIERYELKEGQMLNPVTVVSRLKPWPLAEWKRRCRPQDSTAALCAQILYGITKTDPSQPPAEGGSLDALFARRYDAENRFFIANMQAGWSPFHAEGLALRYADKTIQPNKRYLYQISTPIDPKQMRVDTAFVTARTTTPEPLETMAPVQTEPGDRIVKLKWSKLIGDLQFTGYYYERSDDGGKTFKRLNRRPFVKLTEKEAAPTDFITVSDSLPQNYRRYVYRVAGINHFGQLSVWSDNLVVVGRDLAPPGIVTNLRAENPGGSTVRLTWEKPVKEGDFIGYVIGRGKAVAGPFEPVQKQVFPPGTVSFTDDKADPFGTNFYVVSALDTAGNAAVSLPAYVVMRDEAPPGKPVGLKGSMDSTGVVKITWTPNPEPDLQGYLVYVANAADHVFTPVTSDYLADEFYADSLTLRTLTRKVYYRVVAVDRSERPSAYSDILEVKRPDRVPPVAPVFDKFSVTDSTATLSWTPSSSDDVAAQLLFRQESGRDAQPVLLARLDKTALTYTDKTVLPRHDYAYTLVAEDDSRNLSPPSFPQRVRPYFSGVRPAIRQISTTLSPDKKQVILSWTYPPAPDCRILVYRKIGTGDLTLIENLPATDRQFSDPVPGAGNYQYAIKAIYQDGQATLLSAFSTVAVAR
jgi:uncharacterized protein